jgi:preprotein translocase subunit SecY
MLNEEEEKFLMYWEKNRNKKTSVSSFLSIGLPLGLLISAGILLNYVSGWYTRASMVANSQSTPLVLILAVVLITIFCSVFFRRFKREMNEQRYMELLYKKKVENTSPQMQQEDDKNSQVSN